MADKYIILPYRNEKDVLLKEMREKDLAELEDACKANKETLSKAIDDLVKESKESYSVFINNKLLCCCGISQNELLPKDKGIIWLFSTKYADEYKLSYVKSLNKLLQRAIKLFPEGIYTITREDYKEAIKLNLRLGFQLIQTNIIVNKKENHLFFKRGF